MRAKAWWWVPVAMLVGGAAAALGCSSSNASSSGPDAGADAGGGDGGSNADGGGGMDGTTSQTDSSTPGMDSPSGTDSGQPGMDSGSGPQFTSSDQIIVEPSDNADMLLSAIQGAHTSIHMTMYLLDDSRFIDALTTAKGNGVDVKVILNQTFPMGQGSNQSAFDSLQSGGVSVVWAPAGFTLTHEKCVILDGTTAWIMTMNLEASSPSNREYLNIDTDSADVTEAETIFAADFANQSSAPTGKLLVAPGGRYLLIDLIQSAKTSIEVEGEELSDYGIVPALASAQMAGIHVKIVLSDANLSNANEATAIQTLKSAGVSLVSLSSPYVHAKAMVADGARAYVGSANFTAGSLDHNRELGVMTNNATAVQLVDSTILGDFGNGSAL